MNEASIRATFADSLQTKQRFLDACVPSLQQLCEVAIRVLRGGGKLLFCGNGGSSCDAAHAAGELVGWFEAKQRRAYAAIALGHQVPTLTAIGNDAGYEHVFAREVEAIGRPGDLLIGFTTSGGSKNVVKALQKAREQGIGTAVLCGEKRGAALEHADVVVQVPSANTARIQECHLVCVHVLCGAVEAALGA
ncbi:MAG: SIS domain-containing protein [Planctomycetes bacterium]|nr:SIS domain-containing protein [Planctomycetota bacterium]MCB9885528.1 SIS domain-containing protein [Planctomycetota bacterium]